MVLFVIVVFFTLKRNLNYRSRFLPQFRSYFHCSIFKEHMTWTCVQVAKFASELPILERLAFHGGLKWTRTTDLTLIRRTL